jgi:hypothetical protein
MSPEKVANIPIRRMKYLSLEKKIKFGFLLMRLSKQHRIMPAKKSTDPCPMSPNITPNKNGNVAQA